LTYLYHSLAYRSLGQPLVLSTGPPNMIEGPASAANPISHKLAESSDANFGFKSGTTGMELLVSLSIPKFVRVSRECLRTSESGH